jgi:hypothetical protein
MNLNIFKVLIFVLFFTSCKSKIIENKYDNEYGDLAEMSTAVKRIVSQSKTGIFIFPKVGYVLSLKKGRLDGEMSLICKQDTLYYCIYKNNKPTGKYMNHISHYYPYGYNYNMYYNNLINIRSSLTDPGIGFYNKNNKKEGFWDESDYYCSVQEGTYENGLKHGIWIEDCFKDAGAFYISKIIKYNKGVIIRSSIKRNESSIYWSQGK